MTDRLYYSDSYLSEFDAHVVAVKEADGRRAVVLDRTAFYPTSGGQPFDTGTVGPARVVDVIDVEDGTILHVLEGTPPEGSVACRVDWPRRFEHMQQHTGQHILSAAFERLFDVATVSFHLGSAAATIDLAREVGTGELTKAESLANEVVWEDRQVLVRTVPPGDVATLLLRRPPARRGPVRIVEIPAFDLSACGGTHVARTGAVGLIAISGFERFRGGTRVEFRCGVRALRGYAGLRDAAAAAARLLSTAPQDIPGGIERLQAENRDLRRRVRDLEERLAGFEAEAMASRAQALGTLRAVIERVDTADVNALKPLAQRIASRPGHAAVLVSAGPPLAVVAARAAGAGLDAAALVRALTGRFGGRGGGRPEAAQAGGLGGTADEVIAAARAFLMGA